MYKGQGRFDSASSFICEELEFEFRNMEEERLAHTHTEFSSLGSQTEFWKRQVEDYVAVLFLRKGYSV